jgi:hypothetical protein
LCDSFSIPACKYIKIRLMLLLKQESRFKSLIPLQPSPDRSEKPCEGDLYFFLDKKERPEEAPFLS